MTRVQNLAVWTFLLVTSFGCLLSSYMQTAVYYSNYDATATASMPTDAPRRNQQQQSHSVQQYKEKDRKDTESLSSPLPPILQPWTFKGSNNHNHNHNHTTSSDTSSDTSSGCDASSRCAINLYGLPRSFKSLVLPSLIQHVIRPNAPHHCDYFVHYYNVTNEQAGRSGTGGAMDPAEILLLRHAVLDEASMAIIAEAAAAKTPTTAATSKRLPVVKFIQNTNTEFWEQYQNLTDRMQTTQVTGPDGSKTPLYFPVRSKDYTNATMVNIIKMWHSQQAVWNLMEQEHEQQPYYTRVAMLRSDVVYVTPIDIYKTHNQTVTVTDTSNCNSIESESDGNHDGDHGSNSNHNRNIAVVPAFSKWPVNDRMIYGPHAAVQIWASERFQRMDHHVRHVIPRRAPGFGIHSERFVSFSLFSAIRKLQESITIQEDSSICFLRARADESVWINDCGKVPENRVAVERVIARACGPPTKLPGPKKGVRQIDCRQRRHGRHGGNTTMSTSSVAS
jgi:hypothetical protein